MLFSLYNQAFIRNPLKNRNKIQFTLVGKACQRNVSNMCWTQQNLKSHFSNSWFNTVLLTYKLKIYYSITVLCLCCKMTLLTHNRCAFCPASGVVLVIQRTFQYIEQNIRILQATSFNMTDSLWVFCDKKVSKQLYTHTSGRHKTTLSFVCFCFFLSVWLLQVKYSVFVEFSFRLREICGSPAGKYSTFSTCVIEPKQWTKIGFVIMSDTFHITHSFLIHCFLNLKIFVSATLIKATQSPVPP